MSTPNYPPIIVTGCQRSGTTIATHILADDLDRTPIDEFNFVMGQDYSNCVIQLPQAMDNYVLLQHVYPGVQFLFVNRDKKAIIASMKRIKWLKDDVHDWEQFLERYVNSRFDAWSLMASQIPDCTGFINYDELSKHPFFVARKRRAGFTSKQWQVGQPIGPRHWTNNIKCIQSMYE